MLIQQACSCWPLSGGHRLTELRRITDVRQLRKLHRGEQRHLSKVSATGRARTKPWTSDPS